MNFKDPSSFSIESIAVPPVPDVKAWLQDFRVNRPYLQESLVSPHPKYAKSVPKSNDGLRMNFETMALHNNPNIENKDHQLLQSQYKELKQSYVDLQRKYDQLQFRYNQQSSQLSKLEKQLQLQGSVSDNNHSNANANANSNSNSQSLQWNFDIGTSQSTSSLPLTDEAGITSSNTTVSNTANTSTNIGTRIGDRSVSLDSQHILECRLPSNLDLIRGDILAEAGGNDQIASCMQLLSQCAKEKWQMRNFLMSMVIGIAEENGTVSPNIIYDARYTIKKQLTDLRSAVVKTTCEMLIACSKYCEDRHKYGQCLAYFIPFHLQGLYVTIACIREAHDECLQKSIDNTMSFRCVTPLLKGLNSKHASVRCKVILLLSQLMGSNYSDGVSHKKLERHQQDIANMIRKYISDAHSNVRDAVKQLFESYAKQFPNKAQNLLSKVDINSQKTLKKCLTTRRDHQNQTKHKNNTAVQKPRTRRK